MFRCSLFIFFFSQEVLEARIMELEEALQRLQKRVNDVRTIHVKHSF